MTFWLWPQQSGNVFFMSQTSHNSVSFCLNINRRWLFLLIIPAETEQIVIRKRNLKYVRPFSLCWCWCIWTCKIFLQSSVFKTVFSFCCFFTLKAWLVILWNNWKRISIQQDSTDIRWHKPVCFYSISSLKASEVPQPVLHLSSLSV